MNKLLHNIILLLCIALLYSCKKENSFSSSTDINLFTENLTTLKKGEPILLSFTAGGASPPTWAVTPNTNVSLNAVGNHASIEFKTAGKYTIIATAAGKQGTYIATVIDSSFNIAGNNFALVVNKIVDVAPFSMVEFSVQNPLTNNLIWSFGSNVSSINVAANKKSAQVSFSTGITGVVMNTGTATVIDGTNTQSRTVWLTTVPSSTHTMVPFLYTDKLQITPSVSTDTAGKKTLILRAKTQFAYQCSNDVILSNTSSNNGYSVNYGGVSMSKTICPTKEPASTTNGFIDMPIGQHSFTINFGNKTFTGSVNVLPGGIFVFNWNNNGDVIINPLTVQ